MAKKKALSYRDIIADAAKQNFAPVYILQGEESFYLDLVAAAIEKNAVEDEDRDFNCNIYYGNDADFDMVMAAAKQFPVMAPRRLVMLKEAQSSPGNKTTLEAFAKYVERPNPACVFVLIYKGEPFKATSKLLKAAAASDAIVFNSPAIRDYEIGRHITDYCASKRVSIDPKANAMLAEFLGASLSKIVGEIDKLILASGGKLSRITPEMVEKNIGFSKDFNNFELTSALAKRDYPKAMKIVDVFAKNPGKNNTAPISAQLFNFYQKLFMASMSADKSDSRLSELTGARNSFALNELRSALRYITPMKAVQAIHAIRLFDANTKGNGSLQNQHALLKQLIFRLFTL